MSFPIDHVITVTTDRERARLALSSLGFTLTARGEHPGRGTSNHLMFFGRCYWELLSIDAKNSVNKTLLGNGALAGCALRTDNIERDVGIAAALGAVPGPIESLTRPVLIVDQWQTARFAIAMLKPPAEIGAYLFFCQHLTPELVWPAQPVEHPNGAIRLRSLYVTGNSSAAAEQTVAPLLGPIGGDAPDLVYWSEDDFLRRFGSAGSELWTRPRLAGVNIQVSDLTRCAQQLARNGVRFRQSAGEIEVTELAIGHPVIFST